MKKNTTATLSVAEVWRMILVICVIFSTNLSAQKLTAEKILQNVKAQFDAVKDYSVTLEIKPDIERFKANEMCLTLFFKQPNKFHIESKNFVMIPKQLFEINPADLLSKFDPFLMGKEQLGGMETYKLRLISKPEKKRPAVESYVWIDAARWVVVHFEAAPTEGQLVTIDIDYLTIDGKFTLPKTMIAKLDFQQNTDSLAEKIYSPNRMPRKGSVELRYSDYKVNQGLGDEIFEKKENQK